MQDFRNLDVWQAARRLTKSIYQTTRAFPVDERFGLQAQVRRAAISICANIAEGCGRNSDADFGRFLAMALGSASELECEMVLALDLELISAADQSGLVAAAIEVKRMLAGLLNAVRRS